LISKYLKKFQESQKKKFYHRGGKKMITFQDIQELAHELWLKDGNLIDIEAIAYGKNKKNRFNRVKKNNKVMSDATYSKAKEMYNSGLTLNQIIEELNLDFSKGKLSYWLRKGTNKTDDDSWESKKPKEADKVKEMYVQGYMSREIATAIGKSQNFVLACLMHIRTEDVQKQRKDYINSERERLKSEIKKLIGDYNTVDIAEKLEMNYSTCCKYIREVRAEL
jgi:hypothetical protein